MGIAVRRVTHTLQRREPVSQQGYHVCFVFLLCPSNPPHPPVFVLCRCHPRGAALLVTSEGSWQRQLRRPGGLVFMRLEFSASAQKFPCAVSYLASPQIAYLDGLKQLSLQCSTSLATPAAHLQQCILIRIRQHCCNMGTPLVDLIDIRYLGTYTCRHNLIVTGPQSWPLNPICC